MSNGKHQQHNEPSAPATKRYKVPAAEVDKNGLAYINQKLSTYGQVPATVVAGWDARKDQLNAWQGELLNQGDPSRLTFDEAKVSANVKRAVAEYVASKGGK